MPVILFIVCTCFLMTACNGPSSDRVRTDTDSSLVNTSHLDYLTVPVTFPSGTKASGMYIYSEAPEYHFVTDSDEGFTCVDDVARAALVYLRHNRFSSDTAIQTRAVNLIRFILEMQSENGYFYNFLFPGNIINDTGKTSINGPNWWSWRALQTLTEAAPVMQHTDTQLASAIQVAVNKLVQRIKKDMIQLPVTTKVAGGVTVPRWLPSGSATDQSAILILGLISYCEATGDTVMAAYVKKLADGITLMQCGEASRFPYFCFLSWENTWHAYGSDQAYALCKAAEFLKDTSYSYKSIREVAHFYPWLVKNGMPSSFTVIRSGNKFIPSSEKKYAQIAYGVRPMVFAAAEAYRITGEDRFADIAGKLGAWLRGNNETGRHMYDPQTGRCYDGITGKDSINYNAGAESTIEALLTVQMMESIPAVKAAFYKYSKK